MIYLNSDYLLLVKFFYNCHSDAFTPLVLYYWDFNFSFNYNRSHNYGSSPQPHPHSNANFNSSLNANFNSNHNSNINPVNKTNFKKVSLGTCSLQTIKASHSSNSSFALIFHNSLISIFNKLSPPAIQHDSNSSNTSDFATTQ